MWRGVYPLLLSSFLLGLGMYLWYSLYPKYLLEIGFKSSWVGYIFTTFWAITYLTGVPAGRLADKMGRKRPMVLGLCLSSLSAFLLSYASGWPGHLLLVGMFGLGMGMFQPSSISYVIESSGKNRGLMYSSFLTSNLIGTTTGSYLSGLLKTLFGFAILPFLGGTLILAGVIPLLFLGEESYRVSLEDVVDEVRDSFSSSLRLLKDSKVRMLAMALFIHSFGFFTLGAFIPPYAAYGIRLSDYQIGIVVAVSQVAMASSFPIMGRLVDRFGGNLILSMHITLSTLSWIFYALSNNFITAVVTMGFAGLISAMDFPARRVLIADLSEGKGMASLLGTVDATSGMAMLFAPSFGAYLWSNLGYSSPFFLASLINLGAVPFLIKLLRKPRL